MGLKIPTVVHGRPSDQEAINNSFRVSSDNSLDTFVYILGIISTLRKFGCPSTALWSPFSGKFGCAFINPRHFLFDVYHFSTTLNGKFCPLTKARFTESRKMQSSLIVCIKFNLSIIVAIKSLNTSFINCQEFARNQMSLILVPFIRLFAKLKIALINVTLGYMMILDTRSKHINEIWIPDEYPSMNSDCNICQLCLVQKGLIYYVQDIIGLFDRCNIGIPWEICSHYYFNGNHVVAENILYALFCARVHTGHLDIAVQDSAVDLANAIDRVYDFPIFLTFIFFSGGKVGTLYFFEIKVLLIHLDKFDDHEMGRVIELMESDNGGIIKVTFGMFGDLIIKISKKLIMIDNKGNNPITKLRLLRHQKSLILPKSNNIRYLEAYNGLDQNYSDQRSKEVTNVVNEMKRPQRNAAIVARSKLKDC